MARKAGQGSSEAAAPEILAVELARDATRGAADLGAAPSLLAPGRVLALLPRRDGAVERLSRRLLMGAALELVGGDPRRLRVADWTHPGGELVRPGLMPSMRGHYRGAVLVGDVGTDALDAEGPGFEKALLEAVAVPYAAMRERSQSGDLHILGDESTDGASGRSIFALVAIAPGARLPSVVGFHAARAQGGDDDATARVLTELAVAMEARRASVYVFEYKEAEERVAFGDGDLRAFHHSLWEATVPLVVEHAAARSDEAVTALRVCVEQAKGACATTKPPFASLLHELHYARSQVGWRGMRFPELAVVAKEEHGWLAYADAVAHAMGRALGGSLAPTSALAEALARLRRQAGRGRFLAVPFREEGLRRVFDLLRDWRADAPEDFLADYGRRLSARDVEELGALLEAALQQAVERMSGHAWRSACNELSMLMLQEPAQHAAAHRVLRELTGERILGLRRPRDRAAAVNARLYVANQQGDTRTARALDAVWRKATGGAAPESLGEEPRVHAVLQANALINVFAFEEARGRLTEHMARLDARTPAVLGTLLQCCGYLEDADGFAVWRQPYEQTLEGHPDAELRWACYLAHFQLDAGRPVEALGSLRAAAEARAAKADDGFLDAAASNPYFRAAALKALWFVGRTHPAASRERLLRTIPGSSDLAAAHPWDALAFWGALLEQLRGRQEEARALADHLPRMARAAADAIDTRGVRLAAYWRGLQRAGLLADDPDLGAFEKRVWTDSDPSTQAWLKRRTSRKQRWMEKDPTFPPCLAPLAPLTFANW